MIVGIAGLAGAAALAALALAPGPLLAQVVEPCDWRGKADTIPEPWEAHTRTFANGAVRIALSDPGEPAFGSASLIVMVPGEFYGRDCFLLHNGEHHWRLVDIAGVTSAYDPARGLLLSVPVFMAHPITGAPDPESRRVIGLRINQAEHSVSIE